MSMSAEDLRRKCLWRLELCSLHGNRLEEEKKQEKQLLGCRDDVKAGHSPRAGPDMP